MSRIDEGQTMAKKKDAVLWQHLQGQKEVSLQHMAVLGTVDMLGMSQTVKLICNVLEPRLTRNIEPTVPLDFHNATSYH
jgi:hypothetical protein